MEQSTGNYGAFNCGETFFDDADKEVAEILLELNQLWLDSKSIHRSPFTWGAKRKRSAIVSSPRLHSTPSQPSILRTCVDEDERPISKSEKATSPVTPLSFSPSDSDGKSKRKISKKRTKEEWLKTVTELTLQGELLKGEIETVKRYYDGLKAFNLKLKARKQELSLCRNKEKPNLETSKRMNLAMESTQYHTVKSPASLQNQDQHQIPSTVHQPLLLNDQTANKSCANIQYPRVQMTPSSTGLVRLAVLPDLNISFEESFGMDPSSSLQLLDMNDALTRAMAAEARRKRMKIYKEKNSIAAKPCNGRR